MADITLSAMFSLDDGSFVGDGLCDEGFLNTYSPFNDRPFNDLSDGDITPLMEEEKSPFHESDSGVSDLGDRDEKGSWQNSDGDISSLLDVLGSQEQSFLTNIDENDCDISQHLQSGFWQEESSSLPVLETGSATDLSTRRTRSQTSRALDSFVVGVPVQKAGTREQCSFSGDECDTEVPDKVASRRKPKGSIQVKKVGQRLPTANVPEKCNVTSVKVLRVVQSAVSSNTEDDITKALEDRNRKNAEMARQNRLKKKEYVGNLEREVEDGRKRIEELENALNDAEEDREAYKREVVYLKSVLANQSALAGLLRNIPRVADSGVTLSSSMSRKRVAEHDHSYTHMKKSRQSESTALQSAGVCLHVQNDTASLEFCHHCADMASGSSSR